MVKEAKAGQRLLQIDLLRTLLAVRKHQSFTVAATHLGCTQAAVSQQVTRLETIAGTPLIHRTNRSLQLTDEGRRLADYADQILALNDAALEDMHTQLQGVVRIGTPGYYASHVLPPLLKAFSELHKGVRIEIVTGVSQDISRMLGREIDLLILPESAPGTHVLKTESLHWACAGDPEALLSQSPVPMAMLQPGAAFREIAGRALATSDLDWFLAYMATSMSTIIAVMEAGAAIGALSVPQITGVLRPIDDPRLPPLDGFYVNLHNSGPDMSRSARAFFDFLLEHTHDTAS